MTQQILSNAQPKRKTSSTQMRVWINLIFFVVMVLVLSPQVTGIPIHEWVSFIVIVPFFFHLIMDWNWIVTMTKRLFKKVPFETRFNYFLNWLMFVLFVVATFTGVLISEAVLPLLGINVVIDSFWVDLHGQSANTMALLLGIHLAMHWKWIVTNVKKYVLRGRAKIIPTRKGS
ncbi:MAG: DUF4405 domain-containing protein [Anaerolineae bacterium]